VNECVWVCLPYSCGRTRAGETWRLPIYTDHTDLRILIGCSRRLSPFSFLFRSPFFFFFLLLLLLLLRICNSPAGNCSTDTTASNYMCAGTRGSYIHLPTAEYSLCSSSTYGGQGTLCAQTRQNPCRSLGRCLAGNQVLCSTNQRFDSSSQARVHTPARNIRARYLR